MVPMFFGSVHPLDPMVFELTTIGPDGFSMVANHWSNECIKLVTMDRWGLFVILQAFFLQLRQIWAKQVFEVYFSVSHVFVERQ